MSSSGQTAGEGAANIARAEDRYAHGSAHTLAAIQLCIAPSPFVVCGADLAPYTLRARDAQMHIAIENIHGGLCYDDLANARVSKSTLRLNAMIRPSTPSR